MDDKPPLPKKESDRREKPPADGKDKIPNTPSRFVDESYTNQQIIEEAKKSLLILYPSEEAKQKITTSSYEDLKNIFEGVLLQINSCDNLKKITLTPDDAPNPNITHIWNIMNGFLKLTGQKDDTETWKKVDYAYGKLKEMEYKIKYGLGNKIPVSGGASKIEDATNMFNASIKRGDETAVERYDLKLERLRAKVQQQIEYLNGLYFAGTPKFTADFEKRIDAEVTRLETEVNILETEKYDFIKQVEDPSYKFKTILDKFKTEAEFIIWIEKAKKEHIEAVSEAKKTAQTLKSISTLKKSIDKCIEGMKKSLNGRCEKISKYSSLSDKSKKLDAKYRLILSLSAFMVDPGRGIGNIRDLLEKLGIPSNGLKDYIDNNIGGVYDALYREADDLIRRIITPGLLMAGMINIVGEARIKIQEIVDLFIKNPFLEKIPLIEPEIAIIKQLSDTLKSDNFSTLNARQTYNKLKNDYLDVIDGQIMLIGVKLQIITSILDSASSAPAMDQIRKLRVKAESKLAEINDVYSEIKEEDASPIDVGKCLQDYKAGIAAIKAQNESEFEKIEKEEKESISKIAQDISKIKDATKITVAANIQPQGVPQGQSKPLNEMNLPDLLTLKDATERNITDPATKPDKKKKLEEKLANINAFIKLKSTARGGSRMYAHSTRRKIR